MSFQKDKKRLVKIIFLCMGLIVYFLGSFPFLLCVSSSASFTEVLVTPSVAEAGVGDTIEFTVYVTVAGTGDGIHGESIVLQDLNDSISKGAVLVYGKAVISWNVTSTSFIGEHLFKASFSGTTSYSASEAFCWVRIDDPTVPGTITTDTTLSVNSSSVTKSEWLGFDVEVTEFFIWPYWEGGYIYLFDDNDSTLVDSFGPIPYWDQDFTYTVHFDYRVPLYYETGIRVFHAEYSGSSISDTMASSSTNLSVQIISQGFSLGLSSNSSTINKGQENIELEVEVSGDSPIGHKLNITYKNTGGSMVEKLISETTMVVRNYSTIFTLSLNDSPGKYNISAFLWNPQGFLEEYSSILVDILDEIILTSSINVSRLQRGETLKVDVHLFQKNNTVWNVPTTVSFNDITTSSFLGSIQTDSSGVGTFYWEIPLLEQTGTHFLNISSSSSNPYLVDTWVLLEITVVPSLQIVFPQQGLTNEDPVKIELSGNAVSYQYYIEVIDLINRTWNGVEYRTLSEESYTMHAFGNDGSGNIAHVSVDFQVDLTAPTLSINSPTEMKYGTSNILVSLSGDADHYWYYMEGFDLQNKSWTSTETRNLVEGSYVLHAYANDSAGNIIHQFVNIEIDLTPPSVVLLSPEPTIYSTSLTPIDFTGDAVAYWYYLEVIDPLNVSWTEKTTRNLPDAIYTLHYYGEDDVGNVAHFSVDFEIDTTSPSVAISAPQNLTYGDNSVLLTYNVTDGAVEVFLDSIPQGSPPSGILFSRLGEGEHNLTVTSVDGVGNMGKDTVLFSVDTTPPSVIISSPVNGYNYTNSSITLTYQVSDGNIEVILDTINLGYLPSNTPLLSLEEGIHIIVVRATDSVGNIGENSTAFFMDWTAPSIDIISPRNVSYRDNSVLLIYSVSDGVVGVYLDGYSHGNFLSGSIFSGLGEGEHNLTIISIDSVGNVGSQTIFFSVDLTLPELEILSPRSDIVYSTNLIPISFSGTAGHYWYWIEEVDLWNYSWQPGQERPLSEGIYILHAYGNDSANNVAYTSVQFEVDTTPPTVSIISPKGTVLNYTNVSIELSGDADYYYYYIEVIDPVNVSWPDLNYRVLWNEPYTLHAYGEDIAGNIAHVSVDFEIDTIAPELEVLSPSFRDIIFLGEVLISLSSSSTEVWYYIQGHDSFNTTWTGGYVSRSLPEGSYTLWAYARDFVGNLAVVNMTFSVDLSPPVVSVESPMKGSVQNSVNVFLVYNVTDFLNYTLEFTLDSTMFLGYLPSGSEIKNLRNGSHILEIRVKDSVNHSMVYMVDFEVLVSKPQIVSVDLEVNEDSGIPIYEFEVKVSSGSIVSEVSLELPNGSKYNMSYDPSYSVRAYTVAVPLLPENQTFVIQVIDISGLNSTQEVKSWWFAPRIDLDSFELLNGSVYEVQLKIFYGETSSGIFYSNSTVGRVTIVASNYTHIWNIALSESSRDTFRKISFWIGELSLVSGNWTFKVVVEDPYGITSSISFNKTISPSVDPGEDDLDLNLLFQEVHFKPDGSIFKPSPRIWEVEVDLHPDSPKLNITVFGNGSYLGDLLKGITGTFRGTVELPYPGKWNLTVHAIDNNGTAFPAAEFMLVEWLEPYPEITNVLVEVAVEPFIYSLKAYVEDSSGKGLDSVVLLINGIFSKKLEQDSEDTTLWFTQVVLNPGTYNLTVMVNRTAFDFALARSYSEVLVIIPPETTTPTPPPDNNTTTTRPPTSLETSTTVNTSSNVVSQVGNRENIRDSSEIPGVIFSGIFLLGSTLGAGFLRNLRGKRRGGLPIISEDGS